MVSMLQALSVGKGLLSPISHLTSQCVATVLDVCGLGM